ncbi:MAG: hypothetical protein RRZ84_04025 [Romboutsia sp.]
MLVEVIESKLNKKEAIKYILSKTPLMSRVAQFNTFAKDVHIEYVEFKVLSYEVISKGKNSRFFRHEKKKKHITMIVNTYNGYSQSVEKLPETCKRYVSKGCIKRSKIKEDDIIEEVKSQIMYYLRENLDLENLDNINIENISIKEIKSIYKPYWVADFNGKSIFIDG